MAVVGRGVLTRIRSNRDGFVLQVRGGRPQSVATALARARDDVMALDAGPDAAYGIGRNDAVGPAYVSDVVPSPSGPFLYIDAGDLPDRLLRTIPDIIVARLEEVGMTDARVESPPFGGPLDDLSELGPGVSLHLILPPVRERVDGAAVMPDAWLEEADAWIRSRNSARVWLDVRSVQVELEAHSLRGLLDEFRSSRQGCLAVAGYPGGRPVGSNVEHQLNPALTLGTGGPDISDAGLREALERLKDIARRHASEIGYAFITIESDLFALVNGHPRPDWSAGFAGWDVVWQTCDRTALDAFCWQILGPRHLERLRTLPAAGSRLTDGRIELVIGEPTDWMAAGQKRAEAVAEGRRLLAGCLLDVNEGFALLRDGESSGTRP
jgi:hypothetical protein